jgi:hypothetical protein
VSRAIPFEIGPAHFYAMNSSPNVAYHKPGCLISAVSREERISALLCVRRVLIPSGQSSCFLDTLVDSREEFESYWSRSTCRSATTSSEPWGGRAGRSPFRGDDHPVAKVLGDWGKDKFLLRDLSRFLAEIEQPTTFYRPLLIPPSGLLPVESGKAWFPQPLY